MDAWQITHIAWQPTSTGMAGVHLPVIHVLSEDAVRHDTVPAVSRWLKCHEFDWIMIVSKTRNHT